MKGHIARWSVTTSEKSKLTIEGAPKSAFLFLVLRIEISKLIGRLSMDRATATDP